jgi:hypothetical protein
MRSASHAGLIRCAIFILAMALLAIPASAAPELAWVERAPAGELDWRAIASSSDGKRLAAFLRGGFIYTSGDGGALWTKREAAGSQAWRCIAFSADGSPPPPPSARRAREGWSALPTGERPGPNAERRKDSEPSHPPTTASA